MVKISSKLAEDSNGRNWDHAFSLYAKTIESENDAMKIKATLKLAKMSKCAPKDVLARTVPMLVDLLGTSSCNLSPSIQEASAYCLKCIASEAEGSLGIVIGQFGAIPILLGLLPDSGGSFRIALLKCLRNLVIFKGPNRVIVASNGGVDIVVAMLSSCSDESRLILLEILSALALIREVRKILWNSRNFHFLVEAASCGSLVARTRAAHVIGLIGLNKEARPVLVDAGAVNVLANVLKDGEPSMKLVAGNALGVILSHFDCIKSSACKGVIPLYAELVQGPDPMGKELAEDVFCIIGVHEDNAIVIIEHLIRILRLGDAAAKVEAAAVTWGLASYKHLSLVLKNSGVIPILVELLTDENGDVRAKVTGAVAQVSNSESGRTILADCGAIPILINISQDELGLLRDYVSEALANFSADPLLVDRISVALVDPRFRNVRDRMMQMRGSNERVQVSYEQISNRRYLLGTMVNHNYSL